jgi:hypothetical protein
MDTDDASLIRLAGMLRIEQNDWAGRRYLSARATPPPITRRPAPPPTGLSSHRVTDAQGPNVFTTLPGT